MPIYAYKGVSNTGKSIKGTLSAENLRAARSRVRLDGIILTDLSETDSQMENREGESFSDRFSFRLPSRIPATERAVATRQLSTLISAGIPLVESLSALIEQVEHKTLKGVIVQVRDAVNEGSSLAEALSRTGKFDTLYVSMVRAGEASGALDTVLARMADYLEDQVRLTAKVTSILVYPASMLAFTLLVVTLLVTVVLPQINDLLLSLGGELPFFTRAIIAGSDFVSEWWWLMLIFLAICIFAFRAFKRTDGGRIALDRLTLRLPIIGRVARTIAIARFSRTLSSLLSGGVGIIQALDIARHVARNAVIEEAVENARTSVREGASLVQPLRASGQFPPMVLTMIDVGERAGELESMLTKVAETYDEEVETTITKLTSMMEPLLILIMVAIVLFIIMATLMPLMSVTNSLG